MDKTRIAVVVTARPSWAKLEPVCRALKARADVELLIIACASALLERYGRVVDVIKAQGYTVAAEVWSTYEGNTLLTSAHETGALASGLAGVVRALQPDTGLVVADRHEVLGAAQAFTYQHIPLAHMQGGERSGSVDDKIRDSITALADYHFPCTALAAFRVNCLTGAYDRIYTCGCPSIDVAKEALSQAPVTDSEVGGQMHTQGFTVHRPFVVVLQHPVTSDAEQAGEQMRRTLMACHTSRIPTLVFWPGQDAGAEAMSKAIRLSPPHKTVRNLPPDRFLKLLTQAQCLVGNSSAGIRECSYLGVPVVNIGSRQHGRQRGPNVVDVADPLDWQGILQAMRSQMAHGPYPSSTLYGDGTAGPRIAEVLAHVGARDYSGAVRV